MNIPQESKFSREFMEFVEKKDREQRIKECREGIKKAIENCDWIIDMSKKGMFTRTDLNSWDSGGDFY